VPKLTLDEMEDHLRNTGIVRLATIHHKTGAPRVVPLGYRYADREILITARERNVWLEDIRQDPRVCATVDVDSYPLRKVTISGDAEIRFAPGRDDEWREWRNPPVDRDHGPVILADGRKEWDWLQAYNDITWNEPRALVVVPLESSVVTSWRMPIEGELLEEVWSPQYFHEGRRPYRITSARPYNPHGEDVDHAGGVRAAIDGPPDPDYRMAWEDQLGS
jgi:Pyridoxamine 5'-phosphate oxidase